MNKKYLYLIIILISLTASCQNKKPTAMSPEEKANTAQELYNRPSEIWPTNKNKNGDYYYSVSICSFPNYKSENAGSYFTTGKEKLGFLTMENGVWPQSTSAVLNDEYHPIPKTLFAQWFSISENKFYAGSFEMPTAVIQKYFDEMWLCYGSNKMGAEAYKHERFTDIIVGVAPKGIVIVWVSGGLQQIEIGRYQARETQMDWDDFRGLNGMGNGTRVEYLSNFKELKSVPYGKVDQYRKKYVWKVKIDGKNKTYACSFDLIMYNGEKESIYFEYDKRNKLELRAIPKQVNFNWLMSDKSSFYIEVFFKEDDIYAAFQTISKEINTITTLILKLDDTNKIEKIVLSNGIDEYVLDPQNIKIYGHGKNIENKVRPINEN